MKIVHIPLYQVLRVKEIINCAITKVHISKYLPDYGYNKDLNITWLWKVYNSMIPDEFKGFIGNKVKSRKETLIKL